MYEAGWAVLPGFQGLGIATAAASAVVEQARAEHRHRALQAGFVLLGACEFKYPPGRPMLTNDWRLDLAPAGGAPVA